MPFEATPELPTAVLDAIPNPVLVKDAETRYVWVNEAFERLFSVTKDSLLGQLDVDVFHNRQAAQCNGGDLRVLSSGEVDEAEETVVDPVLGERQTITRKSRLVIGDQHFLVGVMHDITDVTEKNQQLEETRRLLEEQAVELRRLASTDPLTHCLNRRAVFGRGDQILGETSMMGVIVIDLDHFKSVNDNHGHDVGDSVLVHFAETARSCIRASDLLARIGGEEFAILLPGADLMKVNEVASRICDAVAESPAIHGGSTIPFTVSIGAAHTDCTDAASLDYLLAIADTRLYLAKQQGRNQVVAA